MEGPVKIMMIVQGEGRGHLSQAIALKEILEPAGYVISSVIVGKSPKSSIPDYFIEHFEQQILVIESPGLILNKDRNSVLLFKTFFFNFLRIPYYLRQLRKIQQAFIHYQPELILNFHEILCGFWYLFYRPKIKIISIAHQYIYYHHRFVYPEISFLQKLSLELVNYFTTLGSAKRFALHFFQWERTKYKNLVVLPPLIRKKIIELLPENQNFILVYLLYEGIGEEIQRLHHQFPELKFRVYWSEENLKSDENLIFFRLSEHHFIDDLKNCRIFISNAGFESIAESFYLGKTVAVVPVDNHPEQKINARETETAGAGLKFNNFENIDFHKLMKLTPQQGQFCQWVNSGRELFIKEIKKVLEKA